jgi:hypothetical protein
MKLPLITLLTITLLGLLTCKVQEDKGKSYSKSYHVGNIPGFQDFQTYNEDEKWLDSFMNRQDKVIDSLYLTDTMQLKNNIFRQMDSLARADTSQFKDSIFKKMYSLYHTDSSHIIMDVFKKEDFRHNRSRIFIESYTNDKLNERNTTEDKGFSTSCECYLDKDTLNINMTIGFFGGAGFKLQVFRKSFEASFIQWTDAEEAYKSDLNDTAFYDHAIVKGKYQYLILNDKPTFRSRQQLIGYLTITSNNYYEQSSENSLDTNYVTGKLYFACKTRLKSVWDYR